MFGSGFSEGVGREVDLEVFRLFEVKAKAVLNVPGRAGKRARGKRHYFVQERRY